YVEIRDVSRLRPFLDGTAGIYKEPAVAAVLESLEVQEPKALFDPLISMPGVSSRSLLGMLKGPAAFALKGDELALEAGGSVAVLGTIEGEAFQEKWASLLGELALSGATSSFTTLGGAQVLELKDEASEPGVIDDAPPSAGPQPAGFI